MKKVILPLLAILLVTLLASCDGFIAPSIKAEASTQSTASAPTPVPTPTLLPGFTQTLEKGESAFATNGVRAIQVIYQGTVTDRWICYDGSTTTCVESIEGTPNFNIVIDGNTKIGYTNGTTVTFLPGWGQTHP